MNDEKKPRGLFAIGRLVVSMNALSAISAKDAFTAMRRHAAGDWGECGPEDWQKNEVSLKEGFRLRSVYRSSEEVEFWIVTEADRRWTTILLPEDD